MSSQLILKFSCKSNKVSFPCFTISICSSFVLWLELKCATSSGTPLREGETDCLLFEEPVADAENRA